MKRFLIHVDTNWCGEEDTFRAVYLKLDTTLMTLLREETV